MRPRLRLRLRPSRWSRLQRRQRLVERRRRTLQLRPRRSKLATSHVTEPGFLLLEDGTLFRGRIAGGRAAALLPAVAEVVFTTNMTGYQEVFTDPSYRGQIVVMTAPEIGNYGINPEDPESAGPQVAGGVGRELSMPSQNWRASGGLADWLVASQIPIIVDVGTRQLTRRLK